MYSPKIDEELIPRLYRIAKARVVPMTALVNRILRRSLSYLEKSEAKKNRLRLRLEEKEREVIELKNQTKEVSKNGEAKRSNKSKRYYRGGK